MSNTSNISIKRLYNDTDIKKVILDDEMWARVSEDGQLPEDFQVAFADEVHWIGVYRNKQIIGVFIIHPLSRIVATIHVNILKAFRKCCAKYAYYLLMEYVIEKTDYIKLETRIPIIYQSVLDFALWGGGTVEGISRQSILKNNKLIDQYFIGITKDTIEHWIEDKQKELTWQ